jgi:NADH-quinone oxidoreductase subunit E
LRARAFGLQNNFFQGWQTNLRKDKMTTEFFKIESKCKCDHEQLELVGVDKETQQRELQDIVGDWKDKEGNLIMVLHQIQNRYGYVPRSLSIEISKLLHIPLARIYEVITFYNYFKLQQPGQHTVAVCLGTACYLKGAPLLLNELERQLNIKEGETTKDGLFHIEVVRCLGCCGLAPVVKVDDKVYGEVKQSDISKILADTMNKIIAGTEQPEPADAN